MTDVKQFSSDKILKHLDRVNEWLQGGNPAPITMELDMTNRCNHLCPDCVVGYFRTRNHDHLPTELAERIIRELGEFGVRGLIFTGGGEPLCHPDTPAMVALARSTGMDVGFITNGELLTEESARLILGNCAWTRVSLDAVTPATYEAIHGAGEKSLKRVIERIRMLVRLKAEMKSPCTVGVGFLTAAETRSEMLPATALCRDLGVDYLQFRPMQIRKAEGFDYHWEDVNTVIDECRKLARPSYDVLFSKHKYEMMRTRDYGRNYGKCFGHQFASTIGADAKVYVCCHLRHYDKYCLGDLRASSFREIWNSAERKKAVEAIDFKDCIPLCRDNTFNQILWLIKQPREHESFL